MRLSSVGLTCHPTVDSPACGQTFHDFVGYLRQHQVFSQVLYELRPDDHPDVILDADFDYENIRHRLWNNLVSVADGLTFLGTTILPLRDRDWRVTGRVTVLRAGQPIKDYRAVSQLDADCNIYGCYWDRKWDEARQRVKETAYQQLVNQFLEDRALFEASRGAAAVP